MVSEDGEPGGPRRRRRPDDDDAGHHEEAERAAETDTAAAAAAPAEANDGDEARARQSPAGRLAALLSIRPPRAPELSEVSARVQSTRQAAADFRGAVAAFGALPRREKLQRAKTALLESKDSLSRSRPLEAWLQFLTRRPLTVFVLGVSTALLLSFIGIAASGFTIPIDTEVSNYMRADHPLQSVEIALAFAREDQASTRTRRRLAEAIRLYDIIVYLFYSIS